MRHTETSPPTYFTNITIATMSFNSVTLQFDDQYQGSKWVLDYNAPRWPEGCMTVSKYS